MTTKSFIKKILTIIPAGLLSSGIALIDFYYAAKLGSSYANAHSIIVLIAILFSTVGKSLGHPFLIAYNKAAPALKSKIMGSGIVIASSVSLGLFTGLFFLKDLYLTWFQIGSSEYSESYMIAQLVTAAILLLTSMNSYLFLASKQTKIMLLINLSMFIINLIGNELSMQLSQSPSQAFIGLSYASITAVLLALMLQLFLLRKRIVIELSNLFLFFHRAKSMILNQMMSFSLMLASPFIITWIIQHQYGSDGTSVYSLANSFQQFLGIPVLATIALGTVFLTESLQNAKDQIIKQTVVSIRCASLILGIVPVALALVLSPFFLDDLFNIKDASGVLFNILMLRGVQATLVAPNLIILRTLERHRDIFKAELTVLGTSLCLFLGLSCFSSISLTIVVLSSLVLPLFTLNLLFHRMLIKQDDTKKIWLN